MSLAMDLATLCDNEEKMIPMDAIFAVFSKDIAFGCYFVATRLPSILPSCRSASDIGYASKNYLKWQAIQQTIHSIIDE